MSEVNLKINSKGRLCIPQDIREQIGETVTLKRTPEGYLLLPGEKKDFNKQFKATILSKPKRTGKPQLVSPQEMKSISRTKN